MHGDATSSTTGPDGDAKGACAPFSCCVADAEQRSRIGDHRWRHLVVQLLSQQVHADALLERHGRATRQPEDAVAVREKFWKAHGPLFWRIHGKRPRARALGDGVSSSRAFPQALLERHGHGGAVFDFVCECRVEQYVCRLLQGAHTTTRHTRSPVLFNMSNI